MANIFQNLLKEGGGKETENQNPPNTIAQNALRKTAFVERNYNGKPKAQSF